MPPALEGKVCVITGATSGIGRVAAMRLAQMGARLVLVARDPARTEATLARLRAIAPTAAHRVHHADLSRIAEMKRVAAEIAAAEPRIDLLVNNAGALFGARRLTKDGLERSFAVNHMAYFVLTHGLGERLLAAAPARVVNTTSTMHRVAWLDFDDLQYARLYNGVLAYARSKLCNVLFTRELARRWAGTGVTVNCFHPGFTRTRFGNQAGFFWAPLMFIGKAFAIPPAWGAKTLIHLATAPEAADVTGGYFVRCRLTQPGRAAQDEDMARRLWDASERIAGLAQVPAKWTPVRR
jgi:NAD(P)-dependent dehydrogenase (short-subunit alcohol dehydrogenase family)